MTLIWNMEIGGRMTDNEDRNPEIGAQKMENGYWKLDNGARARKGGLRAP